jgi:hypothetical protein
MIQQIPEHPGVFANEELAAIKSVFEETCQQTGISESQESARLALARILFASTVTHPSLEKLHSIGMRAMESWSVNQEIYH